MFNLLSNVYSQLTKKDEFFILIIGLDNAGKTTFLERIKANYKQETKAPEKILPTIGLNVGKIEMGKTRISFWDLGGQSDLQSIWQTYYPDCHGIIFMVDSSDKDRMQECRKVLSRVFSSDEVDGVPVLVMANKQDLDESLGVEHIKEIFNSLWAEINTLEAKVLECSAITGYFPYLG